MLAVFTKCQREAALYVADRYRARVSDKATPVLAALLDRLGRLTGGGLMGMSTDERDLLVRALLRHPRECEQPTGCRQDDHIGDLLLAITDPTGPGEYDSEAIVVVGTLYRLVIGNTQVIVECRHVSEHPVEGGQVAHVIPWTTGGPGREPFPLQSLTVRSWVLTEVLATA